MRGPKNVSAGRVAQRGKNPETASVAKLCLKMFCFEVKFIMYYMKTRI